MPFHSGVLDGILPSDAGFGQVQIEGTRHVFTALIIPEHANTTASHILSPHIVFMRSIENIRLMRDEIDGREMQAVIYKNDAIVVPYQLLPINRPCTSENTL